MGSQFTIESLVQVVLVCVITAMAYVLIFPYLEYLVMWAEDYYKKLRGFKDE